jgi:hypothetical protein
VVRSYSVVRSREREGEREAIGPPLAAGVLTAERSFRRVKDCRNLAPTGGGAAHQCRGVPVALTARGPPSCH